MLKRIRSHLTYANVISTLSLFLVVGGGGAYAAAHLGKGAVKGRNIANNAITSSKVKNGSLQTSDFNTAQLPAGPQGPQGLPGIPGPTAGATANSSTMTQLTSSFQKVLDLNSGLDDQASHLISTTVPSRIFASTDAQFSTNGSGMSELSCNLKLRHDTDPHEDFMSLTKHVSLPAVSGATLSSYLVSMPMVGASRATVGPGFYNVALECEQESGSATLNFARGDLIVWAVKGD